MIAFDRNTLIKYSNAKSRNCMRPKGGLISRERVRMLFETSFFGICTKSVTILYARV